MAILDYSLCFLFSLLSNSSAFLMGKTPEESFPFLYKHTAQMTYFVSWQYMLNGSPCSRQQTESDSYESSIGLSPLLTSSSARADIPFFLLVCRIGEQRSLLLPIKALVLELVSYYDLILEEGR